MNINIIAPMVRHEYPTISLTVTSSQCFQEETSTTVRKRPNNKTECLQFSGLLLVKEGVDVNQATKNGVEDRRMVARERRRVVCKYKVSHCSRFAIALFAASSDSPWSVSWMPPAIGAHRVLKKIHVGRPLGPLPQRTVRT